MAADTVFLHHLARGLFGADGIWDIPQEKGGYVMVAGLRFDNILGDQGMRGMAIVAGSPLRMPAMVPAFVDIIHDMAVVTGRRIIAQVGGEICDVQPRPSHRQQGYDANNDRYFHDLTQQSSTIRDSNSL